MERFKHLRRRGWKRVSQAAKRLPRRTFWTGAWPSAVVVVTAVVIGISLSILGPSWSALPEDPARIVAPLAQVQGAIAAISLVVMVLIVEAVQRREDIVDATYEMFLREAFVRPVIVFVLTSTLGIVTALVLVRMQSFMDQRNLALFVACLAALTVTAILFFIHRALVVLRPSQYRQFKRKAYLERIKVGVDAQIEHIDEIVADPTAPVKASSPIEMQAEQDMVQLLNEIDTAIKLDRLDYIEEDIAIIEEAVEYAATMLGETNYNVVETNKNISFDPPLFSSISQHMASLWQVSYMSQKIECVRHVHLMHLHIAFSARDRAISGLIEDLISNAASSYQDGSVWPTGVARGVDLAWGTVRNHVWLPMLLNDAHPLAPTDEALLRIAIEKFQDSAVRMVSDGNIAVFKQITAHISDLHDSLGYNRYSHEDLNYEMNQSIDDLFQDVRLALAALAGFAILLQGRGRISNARDFVNRVHEILQKHHNAGESLDLLLKPGEDRSTQRWIWWDDTNDDSPLPRVRTVYPMQTPVLYFITMTLIGGPDAHLPQALGSTHLRAVDTLERHWATMCDVAAIREDMQETEKERILSGIKTEMHLEERRQQDRIIATPMDATQTNQYTQGIVQTYKQSEISPASSISSIFNSAGRAQFLSVNDLEAPAESSFRLLGAFKGAFMRTVGTHYVAGPSAVQVVQMIEWARHQKIIAPIADPVRSMEPIPIAGEALFTEISRMLAHLQPRLPLFLTAGGGTGDLWHRLYRTRLNIRPPASVIPDRIPPDVMEALRTGEIMAGQMTGTPALYIVDVMRWGLLRRASIDDEPFRVEVHAISAERAEELLDTKRVNAGGLSHEEAVRHLQLQVEVEVTERIDFVVEDPNAAVRIPLHVPISDEEAEAQDRVESDPFSIQEGRSYAPDSD